MVMRRNDKATFSRTGGLQANVHSPTITNTLLSTMSVGQKQSQAAVANSMNLNCRFMYTSRAFAYDDQEICMQRRKSAYYMRWTNVMNINSLSTLTSLCLRGCACSDSFVPEYSSYCLCALRYCVRWVCVRVCVYFVACLNGLYFAT